MKTFLKKISTNKTFYIILIFLIIYLPTTIKLPAQSDRKLITSAVGIDKINNTIEVSVLMIIPKSSGNIGENFELISEKGTSVSNALAQLNIKVGKQVSFAHCEIIVVSNELLKDDLATHLDFFIRTNNLTTNADIISTENSKDLLKANIDLSKKYSLSIKNVLSNNMKITGSMNNNIDAFYTSYLSKNNSFQIPFVEVNNKNSENSSENSENSNPNLKDASNQDIIKFNGARSILKNGKKILQIEPPISLGLDILNKESEKNIFQIKSSSGNNLNKYNISIEVVGKKIDKTIQFIKNIPHIYYKVFLFIKLDEIYSNKFNEENTNTVFTLINDQTLNDIKNTINEKILNIINITKNNMVDLFNVVNMSYSFCNKDYKNYIKTNDESNLIKDAVYLIDYEFATRN